MPVGHELNAVNKFSDINYQKCTPALNIYYTHIVVIQLIFEVKIDYSE
jgi:hypothetical protein